MLDGGVLDDERRRDARRQLAHQGLRDRGDLREAVWMLALGWKKTLMTPMPASDVRLDVLDVADRGRQAALGWPAMRGPISCAGRPL